MLATSATNALWTALGELLQESINRGIGVSAKIKRALDGIRAVMRGKCFDEDVDDIAQELLKRMEHVLGQLKSAQTTAIRLRNHDVETNALDELQFEIDELQALKEKFSNDWPWSSSWNPPLDREQAARSRAAFNQGECKTIDELLKSL